MDKRRVIISEKMRTDIIEARKNKKITAKDLSTRIVSSPYWLSNIENGKTGTILREDAQKLFMELYNMTAADAEDKIFEYEIFDDADVPKKKKSKAYSFSEPSKEYKRKINVACQEIMGIVDRLEDRDEEMTDAKVYMKYLSIITTFTELFSSANGIKRFEALFEVPIQGLSAEGLREVVALIKNRSSIKYDNKYENSPDVLPELEIKYKFDDLDNLFN